MIRKTDPDGVFLVYSEIEEKSIRESSNTPINEKNDAVIVRQPTDTIPKTDTTPKNETDDVVMDTLEFDCFLCYRWWFCYK
jgi:hypothetical protein